MRETRAFRGTVMCWVDKSLPQDTQDNIARATAQLLEEMVSDQLQANVRALFPGAHIVFSAGQTDPREAR